MTWFGFAALWLAANVLFVALMVLRRLARDGSPAPRVVRTHETDRLAFGEDIDWEWTHFYDRQEN